MKFECPICLEELEYGDEAIGTKVKCVNCRASILVPKGKKLENSLKIRNSSKQKPLSELVGTVLLVVGVTVLVYYWLVFDTSAPAGLTDSKLEHVYNLSRGTDRIVGSIAASGISLVGSLLLVWSKPERTS